MGLALCGVHFFVVMGCCAHGNSYGKYGSDENDGSDGNLKVDCMDGMDWIYFYWTNGMGGGSWLDLWRW